MNIFYFVSFFLIINFANGSYEIFKDKYGTKGVPIQFKVVTNGLNPAPLTYKFILSENVTNTTVTLLDDQKIEKTYIFENVEPGTYRLKVDVYLVFGILEFYKVEGPSHIDFDIISDLQGKLIYHQNSLIEDAYKKKLVSCDKEFSLTSVVDDFHHFFKKIVFYWYINGTSIANSTENNLNYTINEEKEIEFMTKFIAITSDNKTISGQNNLSLVSQKSVDNIFVNGTTNLKRNKLLELKVNFINGTLPYWFCYDIVYDEKTEIDCDDPFETVQNYFKISKSFPRNGTYFLKINAGNQVSKLNKTISLHVIELDYKPQISIIIIPIVSIISILTIIVFGITYHIKNKNKLETEIADFDFEDSLECLSEETFSERLKNTFLHSLKNSYFFRKRDLLLVGSLEQ